MQRVEAIDLLAGGAHDQIAAGDARAVGRAVVGHPAHEHARPLRQADRTAQAPGDVRGCDRHAELDGLGALAAGELLDPVCQQLVGGHGEDQASLQAQGVEAQEAPVEVDQRAAAGSGREWRGVLEAVLDPPAARPAKAAACRGDEPGRGAQAAAAGIAERDDRAAERDGLGGGGVPLERLGVTGVDGNDCQVERGCCPAHLALAPPPVGECDANALIAQVVGAGDHAVLGDDDSAAAPPAAPETDDRRTNAGGDLLDVALNLGQGAQNSLS